MVKPKKMEMNLPFTVQTLNLLVRLLHVTKSNLPSSILWPNYTIEFFLDMKYFLDMHWKLIFPVEKVILEKNQ